MFGASAALQDGATLQVTIPSLPQLKRPESQHRAAQTSQISQKEQASQSTERSNKGTQTDRLFRKYSDAVRGDSGIAAIVAFLRKVVPSIETAIAENCATATRPQIDWTADAPVDATLSHTLTCPSSSAPEQLCCTSVSWSSTGQGIAVAYGRFDVEGWCMDPGRLCTWNLARSGFDPSKPDVTVDVDSCLQCCTYHPQQPGLIAGGTYMGEVYVWNLALEGDHQVFKSALSASSHQEPVTAVKWTPSMSDGHLMGCSEEPDLLISLASDGRLLLWRWQTSELLFGLELMQQHPDTRKLVLQGGTCLAVPQQGVHLQPGVCVVGTEGGTVLKCNISANAAAHKAFAQALALQQKALVSTTVTSAVCQHVGSVHALSASPFDPTLVLSCGLDGQVKVCSSLTRQPLLELAPSNSYLYAAQWSPTRPMLFAVAAGDGRVFLYDLMKDPQHPVKILDVAEAAVPIYSISFNANRPDLFAVTHQQSVKIWTLQDGLSKARPDEQQVLQAFVVQAAK